MTNKVKVWTKQHENILQVLEQTGRYIAKKEYIQQKMEDHSSLYLGVYEWYMQAAARFVQPPADVKYPIDRDFCGSAFLGGLRRWKKQTRNHSLIESKSDRSQNCLS